MWRKLKMNLKFETLHYNTHRTYMYKTTCHHHIISRLDRKHAYLAILSVRFTVIQLLLPWAALPKTISHSAHGMFARGRLLPGSLQRRRKTEKLLHLWVEASKQASSEKRYREVNVISSFEPIRKVTCHIQRHRMRQEATGGDNPSAMEAEQHELRTIRGVICCAVGILYWCEFLFPHDLNFFRNSLSNFSMLLMINKNNTMCELWLDKNQTSKSAVDGE